MSLQLTEPTNERRKTESQRNAPSVETVEIINGANWNSEIENFWLSLHEHDSRFQSPYYHPNFTRAVAAIRDDVEVAILRSPQKQIVAIFPYQRTSKSVAAPIGGRMNDFHGMIGLEIETIEINAVMTRIGISQFGYHALSTERSGFDVFNFESLDSYFVDISDGFTSYKQWVCQNSSTIKRLPQKERSLAREHGQVTFEFESGNLDVLETLIQLKRTKFQRTNTFDILSVDWAANLLREISGYQDNDFRGVLSVLRAGDNVVATHFGMISKDVLHYWFPAYDSSYSKYSPGIQLMMQTCKHAAKIGINKIDMSYGESPFKDKFCNGSIPVHFGQVNFKPLAHSLAKQKYFTRLKLKSMPMKESFKAVFRKVFPNYGKWHFK